MNPIIAAIMGIVQGLTEFLPISSSAHLRLVPVLLHFDDPGAGFTAVIQIGTVAAVLIYFWRDLAAAFMAWFNSLSKPELRTTPEGKMGWAVFFGTLPVVVAGLLLKKRIESDEMRSLYVVAASMIGMAVIMYAAEWMGRKNRKEVDVEPRDGWLPGVLQCLALIPGMSRSGSTITGAFFLGFDREAAIRFSFLMSVPSVLGAGLFELWGARHELTKGSVGVAATVLATLFAFVVGYASIKFLISWISKHGTLVFVIYRLALGFLLIFLLMQGTLKPMSGEKPKSETFAASTQ